ncbi:c-type cytochrome [bacterium]|nr:c-type cytochrome [bacterium]MBU1994576.1 c-type cytochrome [bacterium]
MKILSVKNSLLAALMLSSTLFGADGYEVYKKNCISCHVESMKKSEVLKKFKTLKAPPMVEVSNRLKDNIIIKDDDDDVHRHLFILFVKDYIQNPKLDNSMCHPGALERFGVMPSLKGKLTDDEKEAVAQWLYDRYENIKFD